MVVVVGSSSSSSSSSFLRLKFVGGGGTVFLINSFSRMRFRRVAHCLLSQANAWRPFCRRGPSGIPRGGT